MHRSVALLAGLPLLLASPAAAQSDTQSASARANAASVKSGDATQPEHALGDWGGVRTRLVDEGIDLKAGYLTEVAGIASGGLRHGVDYAHQIKLQADIDGQALAGLDGWSAHLTLLERAGRNASADYLGDDLVDVQEIYGATDHAAAHLGQFYAEHVSGRSTTLDVKAGRLPVGADFATSPLYCQYLSLGLCPQPRGLSIDGSFSVDPSSTWAARARVGSSGLYAAAGVYQARPRYGGPSGFDWGFSHTTGIELPAEIGWTPRLGTTELQGHYKIGVALDTSDRPDVDGTPPEHRRHVAWWALFDQMLVRTGKAGVDGLILLGGWTHADPSDSLFRDWGFVGLAGRGLLPGRPGDSIQLLLARGWISGRLTAAQDAALAAGETLPTGFAPAPGSFAGAALAPGVQTRETIVEANYGLKLHDGVTVVPDAQLVLRPGAAETIRDALVLGFRFEVNL